MMGNLELFVGLRAKENLLVGGNANQGSLWLETQSQSELVGIVLN